MFRILCCSLYMLLVGLPSAQALAPPATPNMVSIVTTIPMLHKTLSQSLLKGAEASVSLLPSADTDPHSFTYSPQIVQLLLGSDMLIVFDEKLLETNLQKLLKQYKGKIIRITDLDAAILPSAANPDTPDPHFWLSPAMMRQVLLSLGLELSMEYPQLRTPIEKQRTAIDAEFALLHSSLLRLPAFAAIPYHDAYGYVTHALRVDTPPVIAKSHHLPISAHQLQVIADYASTHAVGCILSEPQSSDTQLRAFAKAHGLLLQPFDPFGARAESYDAFISDLVKRLNACFTHANPQ